MVEKVKKVKYGLDNSDVKRQSAEMKKAVKGDFGAMGKAADTSGKDITTAYKRAGIRSEKSIRDSSRKSIENFKLLKSSVGVSVNDIARAHTKMKATLKRNNEELRTSNSKLGKAFRGLKSRILAIGVALVGVFGIKSLGIAANFDLEMQKVINVLNKFDEETREILERNASEFRRQFGLGPELFLKGTLNAVQSSITALGESKKLQTAAGKLSVVLQDKLGVAFSLLPDLLKGFNFEASESEAVLGRVLGVIRGGGPSLEAFATQTGKLTAASVAANQTMETLFAVLDAAAGLKFDPRSLISGVNTFMDVIQRAPSTLGQFEELSRKVFRDAEGSVKPLVEIINDLSDIINEIGGEESDAILRGLGFTGKGTILVKRFALGIDEVNEAFARTVDGQKILNEAFEQTIKRSGFMFRQIVQGFKDTADRIGIAILSGEGFKDSIKSIQDLIAVFSPMVISGVQGIVTIFGTLAKAAKVVFNPIIRLRGLLFGSTAEAATEIQKQNEKIISSEKQVADTVKTETGKIIDSKEKMASAAVEAARKTIAALEGETKKTNALTESVNRLAGAKRTPEETARDPLLDAPFPLTPSGPPQLLEGPAPSRGRESSIAIIDRTIAAINKAKNRGGNVNQSALNALVLKRNSLLSFEDGGIVPGVGPVPALVHGEEGILTGKSMKALGASAFNSINNMDFSGAMAAMQGRNLGAGSVDSAATGGGPGRTVTIKFQPTEGGKPSSGQFSPTDADGLVTELERLNIVHGRDDFLY